MADQASMIDSFLDTPEAQRILHFMCFELGHDAAFWRAFGEAVPRRAEDEQAYMMTRLLKLAAGHGAGWHTAYMAQKRERLEPLEALGRFIRAFGPSDEALMPFVDRAAAAWCAAKERPYDNADVIYFRAQWRALPGLRGFVLSAYAKAAHQGGQKDG